MEAQTMVPGAGSGWRTAWAFLKAIPFPLVLISATVILGLASGMDDGRLTAAVNRGFGLNLGYFALILSASFLLAESITVGQGFSLGAFGPIVAPVVGAGMVCCDTAYATLSPLAGNRARQVAVGTYAGFKLLIPAGPLIIGASIGADTGSAFFILAGIALAAIATAVGLLCLRAKSARGGAYAGAAAPAGSKPGLDRDGALRLARGLSPFALLAGLSALGLTFDLSSIPALDFFCAPAGALALSAALAFALVRPDRRAQAAEAALKRTTSLVFVIGSATSLGAMLGSLLPLESLASAFSPQRTPIALYGICFAVAALFKTINGSSMATFATVPPLISPIFAGSSLSPEIATYALCLGSFVAILPNDSFFWITQPPGGGGKRIDLSMTWISILQAAAGFAALIFFALLSK